MNLYDKRPVIAHDVWVAPNATIVGDVEICNDASVWYNVVIRGKHTCFSAKHTVVDTIIDSICSPVSLSSIVC